MKIDYEAYPELYQEEEETCQVCHKIPEDCKCKRCNYCDELIDDCDCTYCDDCNLPIEICDCIDKE